MRRRLLTILAVTVLAFGFATANPAVAHAEGDNTAIAINTKDGSTVFKVAFAIRHVMSDVVDTTNAAVAVASCRDCSTTAIAIEIVLIESNASVITPTNIAFAMNELCSLCVTVAEAFQFVLTTGGPVHFDEEGNRILAEIRRRLHELRKEDLTIPELEAELAAIKAQIRDVLANHLVRVGPAKEEEQERTTTTQTTTTTPPTTGTSTTTPTGTTTTTPTTTTTTTTQTTTTIP